MIRVEVEGYCHKCLDFNPDVIRPERARGLGGEVVFQTDTIVQCTYRKRCAGIKRYLEQQAKEENCLGMIQEHEK